MLLIIDRRKELKIENFTYAVVKKKKIENLLQKERIIFQKLKQRALIFETIYL